MQRGLEMDWQEPFKNAKSCPWEGTTPGTHRDTEEHSSWEAAAKGPREPWWTGPVGHMPAMCSSGKAGQQNPEYWAILDQVLPGTQRR